ncbi:MAG: protoheme IX farnesyltransferase, partial [Cyclobacteriaceae bacterium]
MGASIQHITLDRSQKVKAFYELLKPRLSFLVVFSSGFGFLLANQAAINWLNLVGFLVGGFLISGSSVTINQITEKKYDAVMNRTKNRPIPSNRISSNEAFWFSVFTGIIGLSLLMIFTNPLAVGLSFSSLILYAFVYTPLKRVGPIAVFVGAIPGALPPLIGWAAAT